MTIQNPYIEYGESNSRFKWKKLQNCLSQSNCSLKLIFYINIMIIVLRMHVGCTYEG